MVVRYQLKAVKYFLSWFRYIEYSVYESVINLFKNISVIEDTTRTVYIRYFNLYIDIQFLKNQIESLNNLVNFI